MTITLIHFTLPNAWHVLRQAYPGGRITTLCCDAIDYVAVCVATVDLSAYDRLPHNTCPACRTELAARTPGAAEAVEPSRAVTVDIRNGSEAA